MNEQIDQNAAFAANYAGLLPRDARLAKAARWIALCALALIGLAAAIALIAAIGRLAQWDAWQTGAQVLFAFRYVGSAGEADLLIVLLCLAAAALLAAGLVGLQAREAWAPPYLGLVGLGAAAAGVGFGWTPALVVLGSLALAALALRGEKHPFRFNPVLMKELRGQMRGWRAAAVLTVYLAVMSLICLLLYVVYADTAYRTGSAAVGSVGRGLFYGVNAVQLALILLVMPSFTAGAISGERERQTYDLLQTTLLTHPTFILGKLGAALGFAALLLLAGTPLQSLAFVFGGISEAEIALGLLLLLVMALLVGALGLYFSAVVPRTLMANARAYGATMLVLFVGPIVIALAVSVAQNLLFVRQGVPVPAVIEAAREYLYLGLTGSNPVSAGVISQVLLLNEGTLGFYDYTLRADGSAIPMVAPWVVFVIFGVGLSAMLVMLTVRVATARVRDSEMAFVRFRVRPQRSR